MSAVKALARRSQEERLRDRIAELEATIEALTSPLPEWSVGMRLIGLTPSGATVLAMLLRRRAVSRASLMIALYGLRDDVPGETVIDIFVVQVRRVLRPHGIAIERASSSTVGEDGFWYLDAENRARCLSLIAAAEAS